MGLGSCVESVFCLMLLAFVFVSAFVFADMMALVCFFCGSVIALWLGGSQLLCCYLLCMHSFISIDNVQKARSAQANNMCMFVLNSDCCSRQQHAAVGDLFV